MTTMQYTSKFTKVSRFAPKFAASRWMKMRRFKEGLTFSLQHHLAAKASIPTKTSMSE